MGLGLGLGPELGLGLGCKVGLGCGVAVTWYLDLMKACLTATSACGAGLHIGLLRCASKMALDFAWSGLG